jgi:hypothetical protein
MQPNEIDTLLAEVSAALEQDQREPLTEAELREWQRRLAPVAALLAERWARLKPGGPERVRELAAGRGAQVEALADQCRLHREQAAAQLEVIANRRRAARIREALASLPGAYVDVEAAVAAAESAWQHFAECFAAIDSASQRVVGLRVAAGESCPPAGPAEAEPLPARVAALAELLTVRAHHVGRWPGQVADALDVSPPQPKRDFYTAAVA